MHLLVLNFFVKSIERNTVSEKDRLVIWAGAVDFVGMVRSGFSQIKYVHLLLDSKY